VLLAFDLPRYVARDLTDLPICDRRAVLESLLEPKHERLQLIIQTSVVREAEDWLRWLPNIEGVVAKRSPAAGVNIEVILAIDVDVRPQRRRDVDQIVIVDGDAWERRALGAALIRRSAVGVFGRPPTDCHKTVSFSSGNPKA
jgi:hypothetical protein